MVALSPFIILSLFASSPNTSNSNRRRKSKKSNDYNSYVSKSSDKQQRTGRRRYNRTGDKINKGQRKGNKLENNVQQDVYPLPSLTTPTSNKPTYFTCRHTYEDTLIDEIKQFANKNLDGNISVISPYPGLVKVDDEMNILPSLYDPVYALQTMPNSVVVSGDSIKNIAYAIHEALLGNDDDDDDDEYSSLRKKLRSAPRGSLSIHALVPGMCKGQTKPVMFNRCEKVGDELAKMLRKAYPAARNKANQSTEEDDVVGINDEEQEKWLLQFMLQSNTIAAASLTQCKFVGPGNDAYWPNWNFPLGLGDVNIEEKMPSSAYRKLMEGLDCMRIHPSQKSYVVDLGACPGGWTGVMRHLGSFVTAIDRSKLDPSLMNDRMVEFVKGDAFTFSPEHNEDEDDTWMISDVIAYPDRCTELLDSWCEQGWAKFMVVTMKFQGSEPALQELDSAVEIVKSYGYECRVKHFFNNKNEVTFMVAKSIGTVENYASIQTNGGERLLDKPMYQRIIPKAKK
jgi:23S rRNA C2498 (ribose-2'-O)-methylase RlmM